MSDDHVYTNTNFTGGNEDNRNTDLDNNYNVTSDDADNRK